MVHDRIVLDSSLLRVGILEIVLPIGFLPQDESKPSRVAYLTRAMLAAVSTSDPTPGLKLKLKLEAETSDKSNDEAGAVVSGNPVSHSDRKFSYWQDAPMPRHQLVLIPSALEAIIPDDHPVARSTTAR